jgi:hypothetical protein
MRRICIVLAIVLGVCAAATPAASAATEFGDNCAANGGAPEYTFVSLSAVGDPLPLTAPSSGVITQWKTIVALAELPPGAITESMTVLRPAGGAQFTVVGQSTPGAVANGLNTFATRIPVQAGDHLGLAGTFAPLYCRTELPGDAMGVFKGVLAPGATTPFETAGGYRVPVSAVIEPDADGDGYGDETQDKCPQSAALQTACPVVKLSLSKIVKKSSVKILVSTDAATSVKVTGKVKAGGQKLTLKGGSKKLKAGKIAAFKLAFSADLMSALADLPHGQSLSLKIVASAKNIAGKATVKKLTVKLKGQA